MRVTMSFVGLLRERIGERSLVVELPDGATYRELLNAVGPRMEEKLPDWAWDATRRSFSRRVTVSRNLETDLRDETTCLADGDEVLVFLLMAGG
ncbi:MAG: MoaD/ThiS family protein [Actinobacteria bacterium]|nr:MoaD/ThiS family protein [Actinomycetota bacterium]